MENDTALLQPEALNKIVEFEKMLKQLKEAEDELKQAIIKEMEDKNIVRIDMDEIQLLYIAPTERETFDSRRFRKMHPYIYDEFVNMTPVKASVRVRLK